ncbi:hypothetical protein D9756_011565 [Leucocoprinus leucothites]|uniref:Uncharacterized protein n=1 Tax=Leucocoprinus leucothites TaxID=201217 RepID=A0A8H5CLH9_9AGAR|nr:hypothetical protein D9756_011565 [Leucoagaricus leucothites]
MDLANAKAAVHQYKVIDLVSWTTIAGLFYGIGFTLYCMCLRILYRNLQRRDRQKHTIILLCHSLLVFVLTTIVIGVDTQLTVVKYFDHNDAIAVGSIGYENNDMRRLTVPAVLQLAVYPAVYTLTSVIETWRIWVIWTASPYALHVLAIYVMCYLAMLGTYVYGCVFNPSVSPSTKMALCAAINGLSIAVTLLAFLLIAGRILFVRRRVTKLMKGTSLRPSNEYTSILTMLIESYALVVVVTLGKVISSVVFDIQRPAEIVFSGAHTNVRTKIESDGWL